jgi:CheY-like chemotaxis protein
MASILVIEDVPAVMISLRIILGGQGHDVTCTGVAKAGLEYLTKQRFDLVISDIWMPGINGAEIIRQGRNLAPGTPFLAITGGTPNSGEGRAAGHEDKFGADAVLFKPFEKTELLLAVAALLPRT